MLAYFGSLLTAESTRDEDIEAARLPMDRRKWRRCVVRCVVRCADLHGKAQSLRKLRPKPNTDVRSLLS